MKDREGERDEKTSTQPSLPPGLEYCDDAQAHSGECNAVEKFHNQFKPLLLLYGSECNTPQEVFSDKYREHDDRNDKEDNTG